MSRQDWACLVVIAVNFVIVTLLHRIPTALTVAILVGQVIGLAALNESSPAPEVVGGSETTPRTERRPPPVYLIGDELRFYDRSLPVEAIVHVNLVEVDGHGTSFRVVDRAGQGHQVWEGDAPSARVRAVARMLKRRLRERSERALRLAPPEPAPPAPPTEERPITLTASHLEVGALSLRLRDLVGVRQTRGELYVRDRTREHLIWEGEVMPARVRAIARQLERWILVQNRRAQAPAAAPVPVRLIGVREVRRSLCPYCRDSLLVAEVACERCGTGYHTDCFAEHGDCSVLGCAPTRRRRAA